jgi:hypothetical protein
MNEQAAGVVNCKGTRLCFNGRGLFELNVTIRI